MTEIVIDIASVEFAKNRNWHLPCLFLRCGEKSGKLVGGYDLGQGGWVWAASRRAIGR